MIDKKLVNELQQLVDNGLKNHLFPYKKGNSIRIKNYVIRKNSNGYVIFDCEKNTRIVKTHFLTSALAVAKNLAQGKNIVSVVLHYDDKMFKNYNDIQFYKDMIKKTSNTYVKATREILLDIAIDNTINAKNSLNNFIY